MAAKSLPALLVIFLSVTAGFGQPAEPEPRPEMLPPPRSLPPPPPPPAPAGTGKTVPYGQLLLVPCERATTVPRWQLREVEVGRGCGGPVLSFHEEKQVVTELQLQPEEVEQQVTCMESKPQTVTDPCTGQCRTTYTLCPVVKTVKVKVYHTVPVQREVLVRVPVLKPGPDVVLKKLVLVQTTVPAVETTYRAVTTASPLTVAVPACPALTPPCGPAAPPHAPASEGGKPPSP